MKDERGTAGPIPVESRSILRPGMNFQDQNRARAMQAEGYTAAEVGAKLKVETSCVQGFFDHWGTPVKSSKPRPRAKKADGEPNSG